MINKFKEKMALKKWYYFIPAIGPIIYSVRLAFFVNVQDKSFKKNVNFWKNIMDLLGAILVISLMVSFWILRNTNNYGSFPWMFWVAIVIVVLQNITPFWVKFQYKIGLKRYEDKIDKGFIKEIEPITWKQKMDILDKEAEEKKRIKKEKKENEQP
ncbi:MAG: hypothetical protein HRT99_03980 [Mycoplasmatales bacterium]|nr:hypothetical protein [Mycoplasmatales bacterium]